MQTGVSYALPGDGSYAKEAIQEFDGRYNYIEGWFSEKLAKQIGKADVITDVFGIFNYQKFSEKPALLELYIKMINPGGKILIDTNLSFVVSAEWLQQRGVTMKVIESGVSPFSVIEKNL